MKREKKPAIQELQHVLWKTGIMSAYALLISWAKNKREVIRLMRQWLPDSEQLTVNHLQLLQRAWQEGQSDEGKRLLMQCVREEDDGCTRPNLEWYYAAHLLHKRTVRKSPKDRLYQEVAFVSREDLHQYWLQYTIQGLETRVTLMGEFDSQLGLQSAQVRVWMSTEGLTCRKVQSIRREIQSISYNAGAARGEMSFAMSRDDMNAVGLESVCHIDKTRIHTTHFSHWIGMDDILLIPLDDFLRRKISSIERKGFVKSPRQGVVLR